MFYMSYVGVRVHRIASPSRGRPQPSAGCLRSSTFLGRKGLREPLEARGFGHETEDEGPVQHASRPTSFTTYHRPAYTSISCTYKLYIVYTLYQLHLFFTSDSLHLPYMYIYISRCLYVDLLLCPSRISRALSERLRAAQTRTAAAKPCWLSAAPSTGPSMRPRAMLPEP